jgi:hypothetical protein
MVERVDDRVASWEEEDVVIAVVPADDKRWRAA